MLIQLQNVTAVASPSNICLGESVTITASGADNYVWSNGLGTNSYYILTPSASSTYTVTRDKFLWMF